MSRKLKRVLIICAVLLFAIINLGEWNFGEEGVEHYEEYRVKSGDTFWTVAQKYYNKDMRELYILEYHDELRELNPHLKENHCQLNVNDILTVKYVTKER